MFPSKTVTWTCWSPRCTHKPLLLGQSISYVFLSLCLYSLFHPRHASSRNWLYKLVSWSRLIGVVLSSLQLPHYRHTNIKTLSLALGPASFQFSFLQTEAVLPVNKYSLSFRIINTVLVNAWSIKDETECILVYTDTKHTIALWEEFPSSFVFLLVGFFVLFCFLFFSYFGFSIKAQKSGVLGKKKSKWWSACAQRVYCRYRQHVYRHTHR